MFPTAGDTAAHRQARTRRRKEALAFEEGAHKISNPDELVDFILKIATKQYRGGDRVLRFTIDVPTENFTEWASTAHIGSPDLDQLDRIAIRQEATRVARHKLKSKLADRVYAKLDAGPASKQRLSFVVRISVVGRN